VTIRRYLDPLEAHLARAQLEDAEIAAYVIDPPRYSPMGTGVMGEAQLQVDEQDAGRAEVELSRTERVDEHAPTDDGEGAGAVRCPRCELAYCFHAHTPLGKGGAPTLAHFVLLFVGLARGKRWHCQQCGYTWLDPKEGPAAMTPLEPGDPRPVFRLRRAHAGMGLFLGVILGVLACALGEIGLFLLVAGPVLGYAIGRSLTYDLCSEPKCRARLPRDLEKCPACKGTLAGVVRSAEEHYVAAADVRRELARLREADRAEAQAVDERREAH
jgi:hypothetical protein